MRTKEAQGPLTGDKTPLSLRTLTFPHGGLSVAVTLCSGKAPITPRASRPR